MPEFAYSAARMNGKTVRGKMTAADPSELRRKLEDEKSLYLISSNEVEARKSKPMKAKALASFCRELGMMIGSGVPLIRALNIMVQRDINHRARDSYVKMHQDLQRGLMLSEAMEEQKGVYPDLLVNMYKASETSGNMEETCKRMAEHYEKSYKLKQKVKGAMIYPIILLCVTFVVLMVVFLVVLPKFFSLFEKMNAPMPGVTQFMLNISKFLQNYWLFVIIGILMVVLIFKSLLQLPRVRIAFDHLKLKFPGVGKLNRIIYTARFARTLCSCYTSGISMINSLQNTRKTVGNKYIESQFDDMIADVRNGEPLSVAVGNVDGFDPKLPASILIGEETGRLDSMLEDTADSFDFEAESALSKLVSTVEPVLIVLMAVIIGTVMISVILPLPRMYNAVGGQGGM